MAASAVTLSETLKLSRADRFIIRRTLALSDLMIAHGTLSRLYRMPTVLRSTLRISTKALTPGFRLGLALSSAFKLTAALVGGRGVKLSSTLRLTPTQHSTLALLLSHQLQLTPRRSVVGRYAMALRQTLKLTSSFGAPGWALRLSSTLRVAGNLTRLYQAVARLQHALHITSTLTPKLHVIAVISGNLRLTATTALRGLFNGTLRDVVDFAIEVAEPSGEVTTWALNVRTGALSEYTNFDFNSFAQGGANTYLGARSDGLYELVGADDAGVPVIGDIISGLASFSGSFQSGIKAAYLGLRATGQFYLKITSGDGRSTLYSVQADNLRTARVNLGKGLRAKFFTFELISTGQDFDLQDITFLPLQSTRRI